MTRRILAARCNVQNMTSVDAKMTYIKAWQRLSASGAAFFIVTFKGSKKKVQKCYIDHCNTTNTACILRYDTIEEINVDSKAEYTA